MSKGAASKRIELAVSMLVVTLLVASCIGSNLQPVPLSPGASGGGGGTPAPTAMTAGALRLAIMDRFGPRWWCDPDFYPLARDDEQALAIQHFAEVQSEADVFRAVVAKLGLAGKTTFSDAQKLAIYQIWKPARSFPFDSIGNGRYRFDYVAQPTGGAAQGTHVIGTITNTGDISIEQQGPAEQPNCPICLARGTLIGTPAGPVAVEELRLGDPVWTFDAGGRRIAGSVVALGSTPAPIGHHVVHLRLADGRTVTASPGHPLADGSPIGNVRVGDLVDGSRVVAADVVAYDGDETFDLVASGQTGGYYAGGVPLLSTIRP